MINILLNENNKRLERVFTNNDMCVCGTSLDNEKLLGIADVIVIRDSGAQKSCFEKAEKVRRVTSAPVIMLPDEMDEMYTVIALDKGADIVLSYRETGDKELLARTAALARRYRVYNNGDIHTERTVFENGTITLDSRKRCVYRDSRNIRMTSTEYGIVECLMKNIGNVCSIESIYSYVWNEEPYLVNKTVTEYVRRIRAKLEVDPHAPKLIKTVSGVGYFMVKAG